jgi:hypothetical protein
MILCFSTLQIYLTFCNFLLSFQNFIFYNSNNGGHLIRHDWVLSQEEEPSFPKYIMWPVDFFTLTSEDSPNTTIVPGCYLLFVLSSVVQLCKFSFWWGRKTFQKVLKVHEKSADHRRMSGHIPDDSMSNEDDICQDTYDDPTHKEVNDPKTDNYSSTVKYLGYNAHPSKFKFESNRSANFFSHHAKNKNGPSCLVSTFIFGYIHATGNINYQEVVYHIRLAYT